MAKIDYWVYKQKQNTTVWIARENHINELTKNSWKICIYGICFLKSCLTCIIFISNNFSQYIQGDIISAKFTIISLKMGFW